MVNLISSSQITFNYMINLAKKRNSTNFKPFSKEDYIKIKTFLEKNINMPLNIKKKSK